MTRKPSLHPQPHLGFLLSFLGFLGFISADSIHAVLSDHGLPAGLLPRSVRSFSLDQTTGLLSVQLDRPCYAEYERSPVHFDREVKANLSYGGLRAVTGLSQEELFLWLPVKEIVVADPKSGVILFDIGVAHKQLSMSIFENPPDCRPEEEEGEEGLDDRKEVGFQEQR